MKEKTKSAAKAPAASTRAPKRAAQVEKTAAKKARPQTAAKPTKAAAGPKARTAAADESKKTPRAKKPEPASSRAKKEPAAKTAPKEKAGSTRSRKKLPEGEAESASHSLANAEMDAFREGTHLEASDAILEAGPGLEAAAEATESYHRAEGVDSAQPDAATPAPPQPANPQRLQKILSQAGIASRRHAEEMIVAGRVIVNGQVVTTLGSKADPARDHIRVDGKLLHGAERHRYFLLNKPRGFVTTVSDPEGRPTVMQFFAGMRERLYPVGRLDYQSEGLLLMTNDGELANLLTKAGSGVEKTYLVKVAGRPTEEELERLRAGVTIERAEEGSERVRTAPARVHQVRVGDNPWFEVVLIEGRNRELRKMFAAVGHFVEKIRRVGYGPLVLDVEPGKMRELSADELNALRRAAEGKIKPRRLHADRMPPKDAGRAPEKRHRDEGRGPRGGAREFGQRERGQSVQRPREGFGPSSRPFLERSERGGLNKGGSRPFQERAATRFGKSDSKPFRQREAFAQGDRKPFPGRPERGGGFRRSEFVRPRQDRGQRGEERGGFADRPARPPFPGAKPRPDQPRPDRPSFDRPKFDRPRPDRPSFDRPRPDRPRPDRPSFGGAPPRHREGAGFDAARKPFREGGARNSGAGGAKPFRPRAEHPRAETRFEGPSSKPDARPESPRVDGPRGDNRAPRQGAPAFRGQGRNFGGKKPGFGGGKPAFGARPGRFGGPPRQGARGGSRPGGGRPFGGKKRG